MTNRTERMIMTDEITVIDFPRSYVWNILENIRWRFSQIEGTQEGEPPLAERALVVQWAKDGNASVQKLLDLIEGGTRAVLAPTDPPPHPPEDSR